MAAEFRDVRELREFLLASRRETGPNAGVVDAGVVLDMLDRAERGQPVLGGDRR